MTAAELKARLAAADAFVRHLFADVEAALDMTIHLHYASEDAMRLMEEAGARITDNPGSHYRPRPYRSARLEHEGPSSILVAFRDLPEEEPAT